MGETVLLTGANGFLGAHLTRELLGRGYRVRALVRAGHSVQTLTGLPVDYHPGDLLEADSVERAAIGCQAIIHAGALAQVHPARNPTVWAVNHTGTSHVLSAAKRAAVQRLVYVGTANVFGFGTKEQPGNETTSFAGQRYGLDYIDSKRAAMELVQRAVQQNNLPAVLVHPTFMLGAFDAKPTSGRMLLELHRGRVPGYPAGGKNVVHVRDVAVATVNALTQGTIGESYILGHENLNYGELFGQMAQAMHVAPPRWAIPPILARLYATGLEHWSWLTGQPGSLNTAMAAIANDGHYFSAQKAITELALPQTPVAEAIAEAFAWFKQQGYVSLRTERV